jgi:branched-chain amino acid transport system ATP-binding protein
LSAELAPKDPMLSVSGLQVQYGSAVALRGVDLKINQGEIVAVVGRNGAGKTTLLRAITGLEPVRAGTVAYKGRLITGLPAHRILRLGIAHVPQGRQIFGDQSVAENLMLGGYTEYFRDHKAVQQRLKAQYDLFPRLWERRHQLAGTLSGGEQQMLALGRALMSNPDLIVMDEPSMGLAPLFVKQVLETVLRLKAEGRTVLLVEQLAAAALQIADRAWVLQTGTVVAEGEARALLHDGTVMRTYLGA